MEGQVATKGDKTWVWRNRSWLLTIVPALLATLAAIAASILHTNDTYILNKALNTPESQDGKMVYLVVGSWLAVISIYVFSRWILPALAKASKISVSKFEGLKLIGLRFQLGAFFSGLTGLIGTFAYMEVATRYGDPTPILVLGPLVMVYTSFYDAWRSKTSLLGNLGAVLIVFLGAVIFVNSRDSQGLNFGRDILLLMLLWSNIPFAVSRIVETEVTKKYGTNNLLFWRFVWFALLATISVSLISWWYGTTQHLADILITRWEILWPFLLLTIVLIVVEGFSRVVAQVKGNITEAGIYGTLEVFFALPVTWLWLTLDPKATEVFNLPQDQLTWNMRIAGTVIIFSGALITTFFRLKKRKRTT